jgi:hypothetical protein
MKLERSKDFLTRVLCAAQTKPDPFLVPMVRELADRSEIALSAEVASILITPSTPKNLIRVSAEFIEKYASTDDDLLFLLLHEMVHQFHQNYPHLPRFAQLDPDNLTGAELKKAHEVYDSIQSPLDRKAASMIEDIRVNAILCARWFPEAVPLLLKLHNLHRFPDILQIPPVLLDLYRGRVLDLNPLYQPPRPNSDYDFTLMLEPEFHTRLSPVFARVENLPAFAEIDDGSDFYKRDADHFWVKGVEWWYWNAWSAEYKCTLATYYDVVGRR